MLSNVMRDQVLYGETTLASFTHEARDRFIEHGFARRRPGTNETVIDEPLVIIAAAEWLSRTGAFSIPSSLLDP
jgi:hypothetical protein